MLFNSVIFGIFFVIVFYLYWLLFKNNIRLRNIFLIICSYIFYGWWDWRFLSLIIISSTIDYVIGLKIHSEGNASTRKKLLQVSLLVNLGFLGVFKYFNFFIESLSTAFGTMGFTIGDVTLNIILPVGISFYTFQTLSYTLDIYYRKMEPTKDPFAFFAFVSFFPQLVAGPIERAKHLLPQFSEKKEFIYDGFQSGLLLMAWGFFKKIVIADRLAKFVDNAYKFNGEIESSTAAFAVLFFTFQLYLDFSAYSDIAIGSSRLLGFNLSLNFKRPYLATSFSDFWNRWHISLSSWFRDYVYIPLGGNRGSKNNLRRNILIVFLLSGLWHGASWNFVIWGFLNALFLLFLDGILPKQGKGLVSRIISGIIITVSWSASLVFFRAQSFDGAIAMYNSLVSGTGRSIYKCGLVESEFKFTIFLLVLLIAFEIVSELKTNLLTRFYSFPAVLRWSLYIVLVLSIIMFGKYGERLPGSNFVYFQF